MILPIAPDTLGRARTGDVAAFERLLRMHERQVLGLAVRLTGNLHDAQDVAQEVFIKLHRELRRFSDIAEIAPWLYRVTVNECFDVGRKAKRSRLQSIKSEWATWPSAGPTPEEQVENDQDRKLLADAMRVLTERERAVIALRELEGLSTAEVAETLGSAESTVRVQIANARLKLRKYFEGVRGKKK